MLEMKQTQGLALQQTLSPQMRQSLRILQAPLMELKGLVSMEMMVNPTLEEEPSPDSESIALSEDEPSSLEDEWSTYYVQSAVSLDAQERHQFLINSLTEASTLQRLLSKQVGWLGLEREDGRIAAWIVGNIDDSGYLEASVQEIARLAGAEEARVEQVLKRIQALEPAGVAARDLRECLLLQLQRQKKEDTLESKIVSLHLDALGRRKLIEIARALRVSLAEVSKAMDNIGRLNPKPGRALAGDPEFSVAVDVVVEKDENGAYQIALNNSELPRLRISPSYKDLLSQTGKGPEVREYVREKIRGGRFFIRSIQQRQETLLAIAQQIVNRQQEFLEEGPGSLRPMTMAQIAAAVGLHETTVSRAVSGKYIATPQGIFELKYFFTSGYQTAEGESVSNASVRKAISEIVSKEDPYRPWSDQEMVALLKERGYPVARRTVAKYREQLSILPRHLRKKV